MDIFADIRILSMQSLLLANHGWKPNIAVSDIKFNTPIAHITLFLVPKKTAFHKLHVIGTNADKLWHSTAIIYVDDACFTITAIDAGLWTFLMQQYWVCSLAYFNLNLFCRYECVRLEPVFGIPMAKSDSFFTFLFFFCTKVLAHNWKKELMKNQNKCLVI